MIHECNEIPKGSGRSAILTTGLYGLLLLILFLAVACSRSGLPSVSISGGKKVSDSSVFDYLFAEAVKMKLLGNAAEALKSLQQCLQINPESDAVYHQMAQIALQLGETAKAKKFAEKAVSIDEKNIWYINFLAGILYQENKADSAMLYYEKAVRIYPERNDLKLALGSIYTELGKYESANELYQKLEERYGINEKTTLLHVRSLISGGNFDAAEKRLKILLEDAPEDIVLNGILAELYREKGDNRKASELYDKLMSLDAANPQTLLSYCDFMLAEKQYDNLFTLLNVIALNERIGLEGRITLLARMIEENDLIKSRRNEIEVSLRVFEEADKKNGIIALVRPEMYIKLNEKDKAVSRLEEIITEYPDNYYAWEKLLLLYSELSYIDKLFEKGYECATKFNRSYMAKILYASAATEKGKTDIALEELRKAKILAGDQKELIVQVLSMEADVYYRKGEYEKSFGIFRQALEENPDDLIILNNYAYFLAEQSRELKEAERMIRIVIDREKENNTFLDTYAWVLFKRGKTKDAIRIMEEIFRKDPSGDAEWFEHYGYMMKKVRKCERAAEYWKKALDMAPGNEKLKKEIENCRKRDL